jgi:hypothetical protein
LFTRSALPGNATELRDGGTNGKSLRMTAMTRPETVVARIFKLPYRRLEVGWLPSISTRMEKTTSGRLQTGDTADYKSALRFSPHAHA